MANVWSISKAILDIIDENYSDTESIFSGDSSNYEPENSETEDEEPNNRDDDTILTISSLLQVDGVNITLN
jgi:hypothetical protein